ncbi:hypothetical protein TSAR_010638 [Trichomalopsis sarcophagae]|uniref:Integrin-alpha FG-GAP repeat-containing protein 2 n=1 Tax=Trichomalopsis sarcophagae TaxID=543379 RepID=A0A232F2H0_9HYME|nr:hypothetical protein TSAR_010638 [Trichomalopsis sarcophagae]
MRAVCFVKRLQWDVPGTLFRHGLTIGDVDNDGDNELVVGTAEGDLYIFKGLELWQKITGLGLITSVAIGDIFNCGRNALIVICGDGWVHIYYSPRSVHPSVNTLHSEGSGSDNGEHFEQNFAKLKIGTLNLTNLTENAILDHRINSNRSDDSVGKMKCVHVQRIPTNTKVVLVADVDKDGANEMIIGLTDRVVRSYRWSSNADLGTGKLIGLNKWECANQIGTVTLQDDSDGTPTLLVAQPGGTFMRIKCNADDCQLDDDCFDTNSEAAASGVDYQTLGISRMRNPNISTEILGNLKPKISNFSDRDVKCTSTDQDLLGSTSSKDFQEEIASANETDMDRQSGVDMVDGNLIGGNVVFGEFESKKDQSHFHSSFKTLDLGDKNLIERDDCAKFKEQKQTVNTQSNVKEDNKSWSNSKSYALATLDGTIMSMQVDHHISALCPLDVTGDGADEIIACTWDGQTYILDQQRNSVRFQFEEPVRAFCAGMYSVFPRSKSPCLVYNNFFNKIFLYYDVSLPSMVATALNPTESLESSEKESLKKILADSPDCEHGPELRQLTEWLLYGMR